MENNNKTFLLKTAPRKKEQENFNEKLINSVTNDLKKLEIEGDKYLLSKKTSEDIFFREYLKIKEFNQGNENFDIIYKHLDKFLEKNNDELRFKTPEEMKHYLLQIEKVRLNQKNNNKNIVSSENEKEKNTVKESTKADSLENIDIEKAKEITRTHEALKQITTEIKGDHLSFYFIGLLLFVMLFIGLIWTLFAKKR